jgi:hypothetical protein
MAERQHLELLGINRNIVLQYIFKKWNKEAWIGLIWFNDRDRWRTLVNAVMNIPIP